MREAIRRSTLGPMSSSTIQVLLELDPRIEPIAGILRQPPNGDPKPFTGWLQLTQMLEASRTEDDSQGLRGRVASDREL
jgi:hypothetical protein